MPDNVQMQGIEFEIRGSADKAAKSLDKLASSLSKIGGFKDSGIKSIASSLKSFQDLNFENLSGLTKALNGISSSFGKVSTVVTWLQNMSEIDFSNLKEAKETLQAITGFGKPGNKVGAIVDKTGIGEAKESDIQEVKSTSAETQRQAVAERNSADAAEESAKKHNNLNTTLKSLRTTIDGVVNSVGKLAMKVTSGAGKLLARPFIQMGNSIKNAVSKIGQLESSFKRILFYRAIRSVIKQISNSFKEGTNNLYYYSQAMGTQFASSMDQLSTAFQYFKNSVGAAASPLINALAPAIDYVIDRAVALLNVLNQLFARLSGAAFWTRATKQAKQYGAAVGGAGGAAKEAMRYLAPFDELNVLPDNSSGGGGGGGAGGGYEDMFEEVAIDSALADFVDRIKAAINAGDWYGAGQILGQKINEIMPSLEKFSEWGEKVGNGIQHGIDFALGTLREIDFTGLGSRIATFFNNLFGNINPKDVGALLASKLRIAIDTAYGFVTTFKWDEFGDWIGEVVNGWFAEIDWEKAAKTIGQGIIGLLTSLRHFLQTTDWKQIGLDIGTFLSEIEWGDLFENIVGAIGDAVNAFLELFNGWSEKMPILARLVEGVAIAFAGWKIGSGIVRVVDKVSGIFGIGSKVASAAGKATGSSGGGGVPKVSTVLKGLGDIALIIGGATLIVTAIGGLMSVPGFSEAMSKGISVVQEVFRGIGSIALELTGVSAGIVALGHFGVAQVAKGFADMAIIVDGVPIVLTALGALMSIPGFNEFASTGVSVMKEVFTGIGEVGLQFAGTAAAIVALGFVNPATVALGLAGFAIVVDGVAGVIASLGALAQIPGFTWLVGEGGNLLMKLGEILGGFAGSIIEGFLDKATEGLEKVGEHLSGFAKNLQPFISIMSGITDDTATSARNLAAAILELTAANFIDQLSNVFGGSDSWETFGTNLVSFADYFVQYAEKMKEVSNMDVVNSSAQAAGALAQLANDIPSQGGVVGWFWSQKDLSKFGEQIVAFGDAIFKYAAKVTGLKGDVIQASANAAQSLVQLSNDIPSTGGVVGWFWEQKNIGQFGEQLVAFGNGMKNYYNSIKDLNGDVIQKSANAAAALVQLGNEIPSTGGILGWIFGNQNFETFGNQLAAFGNSMKQYADSVADLNTDALGKAVIAARQLIDLAKQAEGIDASKLVDFGTAVSQFGANLSIVTWTDVSADFSSAMSTVLGSLETTVSGMIESMSGMQETLLTVWNNVANEAGQKWESTARVIDQKTQTITTNVTKRLNEIKKNVNNAWSSINKDAATAWGVTIRNTILSKWDQIIRDKTTKTNTFKNDLSSAWDSMNTIASQKWDGIKSTVLGKFDDIKSGLQTSWNNLYSWWSGLTLPAFNVRVPSFYMYGSFDPKTNKTPTIGVNWNTYAQGGFPEDGLFFANHGELVGEFSNGKTAVANNEQIVEGIKAGVFEAVVDAFSRSDIRGGSDQPIVINLDGKQIAQTTTRYQKQTARAYGV